MSDDDDDERPIERSLIDAALPALEPTSADHARVRQAVLASVAGGAVVAGLGGAHAASSAASAPALTGAAGASAGTGASAGMGALGLAWKIGLGVAAVATVAGAVSIARVDSSASEPERAPVVAPTVAPITPVPHAPVDRAPAAGAPSTESAPSIVVPPTRPAHTAARTTPPQRSSESMLEEATLIARANAAIDRHDGRAALAVLAEHARRYPEGQLREERYAGRILALCELGDVARARAEAAAFLNVFPGSAHAERIRASCGGPSTSDSSPTEP